MPRNPASDDLPQVAPPDPQRTIDRLPVDAPGTGDLARTSARPVARCHDPGISPRQNPLSRKAGTYQVNMPAVIEEKLVE